MLRDIALGALIGMAVLGLPLACSRGGELPALVRCQLDALKILPDDPMMVSFADGVDLVHRLHACKQASADAGQ